MGKRTLLLYALSAALGAGLVACAEQAKPPTNITTRIPPDTRESPTVSATLFAQKGDTDFITANQREQLSDNANPDGTRGSSSRGELAEGDSAAGAASNEGAPTAPPSQPAPEPDPTRTIVEGDIFKVEGSLLYVLHRYRGLVIFDVSRPDDIKVLGRLPFQATPVEMYVRDGRAYAIVSDYFQYWQYDKDADPLGFHGSVVLVADVSNPHAPMLLGQSAVKGEVSDSRMVGDVLYVVSKRNPEYWRYNTADWQDTTWVMSVNVADPTDIHAVGEVEFPGTATVAHVYHHAVFVAAHDPNAYLTDPAHEGQTLVTYVDIADPTGRIAKRGSLYVPGYLQDKFKLDFHENTLRVFSSRSFQGQTDGFVHTVDVGYPDTPRLVASLDLSNQNYGWLQGTRMAGTRGYAMTQRYRDGRNQSELHVVDLTHPASPTVAGRLPIDGYISHFEVRGDRVLAMGHTYRYQGNNWTSYSSLTLFDVADAAAPRLVSTVRLGEGYSYSLANSDYKALRVLDELGLILVPLQFYNGSTSFSGIQLIDYGRDALRARGLVPNAGSVERAFIVGERVVSLSQQQIQVVDTRDRDQPRITASMNLIRNVQGLWNIGGKQVQLIGPVLETGSRFEVLPFGREDDAPSLATLALPFSAPPVVFRDGQVLRLIGWEQSRGQVIRNADFTDVTAPRLRGELLLTNDFERIYSQGGSFYYLYWSPWAGLPLENRILPVTVRRIVEGPNGRRDFQSFLRLVDLRALDNPRVARGEVPMPKWPFVNKVTHGNVLHSSHVEETKTDRGETRLYHVRSYLDRIDVTDPDNPRVFPKVNIPGYVVDVSDDGRTLFTIDYQWDEFGRRRNALNVLDVDDTTARVVEMLPVGDQVNRAVFRDRTVWLVSQKYPWWGVGRDTLESRQPYTVLSRIDVDLAGHVVGRTAARLPGYHFELLDVEGTRAYLASHAPYGVMVLDASDAARPVLVSSARTVNYVSKVVAHEDHVYLPLGWFGVHRVPATASAAAH